MITTLPARSASSLLGPRRNIPTLHLTITSPLLAVLTFLRRFHVAHHLIRDARRSRNPDFDPLHSNLCTVSADLIIPLSSSTTLGCFHFPTLY
jgi:hypothetical protein